MTTCKDTIADIGHELKRQDAAWTQARRAFAELGERYLAIELADLADFDEACAARPSMALAAHALAMRG